MSGALGLYGAPAGDSGIATDIFISGTASAASGSSALAGLSFALAGTVAGVSGTSAQLELSQFPMSGTATCTSGHSAALAGSGDWGIEFPPTATSGWTQETP